MVQALVSEQQVISTGTKDVDYREFIRFQITVQKVFKSTGDDVKAALQTGYIYSSRSSDSCGVGLTTGKVYIISAGLQELSGLSSGPTDKKLGVYSCAFHKQVESLTADEIEFFNGFNITRT